MWSPGEIVIRREVLNDGRAWLLVPVVVVDDQPDLLATYIAPATPFAFPDGDWPSPDGRHPWHGRQRWQGNGLLMLQRPGESYAIWLFWHGPQREFRGWYVNLQEPFRRTVDGYDTQDLELDIWVPLDAPWEWKDDALLDQRVREGRFTRSPGGGDPRRGAADRRRPRRGPALVGRRLGELDAGSGVVSRRSGASTIARLRPPRFPTFPSSSNGHAARCATTRPRRPSTAAGSMHHRSATTSSARTRVSTAPSCDALAQGEYVLERCGTCSLIWQRFAPSEPLLERIYGAWRRIDGGIERHDNLHYQQATAEEILLLLELVQRRPGDVTVLDFGMGWGRWPRFAAAFGCRAFGVELGESQVAFARGQGIEVLALEELSGGDLRLRQLRAGLRASRRAPADARAPLALARRRRVAEDQRPERRRPIPARLRNPDWSAPRGSRRSLNAVAPLEHLNCFNQRALDALGEQVRLRRQAPGLTKQYAATIGLWPPRRLARAVARPPLRRLAPGATYFRHAGRS